MIYNGKRTIAAQPKDIGVLRRDERRPDLSRWQPLIPRLIVLALLAAISRSASKLLTDRRRGRSGVAP
jgi:hypothetical protein